MSATRDSLSDKTRLSADAWAQAALDAIAEQGIAGVAVEPLARRLGVTKGSFYWHFSNREALLKRALERWEEQETGVPFQSLENETDPRRRLQRVIREVNTSLRTSRIYQALSAAADDPLIAAFVTRVSTRRIQTLRQYYRAAGLSPEHASRWARLTYSVFLGTLQLRRDMPAEWPQTDSTEFSQYIAFLEQALLPDDDAMNPDLAAPADPGATLAGTPAANAATKS